MPPPDLQRPVRTDSRAYSGRCRVPGVRTGRHGPLPAIPQHRPALDGQPSRKPLAVRLQANQTSGHLYCSGAGRNLHQRNRVRNSCLRLCLVRVRHVCTQPAAVGGDTSAGPVVCLWPGHVAGVDHPRPAQLEDDHPHGLLPALLYLRRTPASGLPPSGHDAFAAAQPIPAPSRIDPR
ncbi:hypothetical protein D3C77_564210 [compost metagenome]